MKPATEKKTDAEGETPASRKRATWLSIGFIVAVGIVVWAFDGVLLFKLRMIANEAYTERNYPMLSVDAVNELEGYAPRRLAKFVAFPSTQISTVSCMAIGIRRDVRDSDAWVGVVPALLKAHRDSDNDYFKLKVTHTLDVIPVHPKVDREFVFAYSRALLASGGGDSTAVAAVLSSIAFVDPSDRQRALAELAAWLPKESDHKRKQLLDRILRIDPESSEAADAVRWASRDVPYHHFPNLKPVFAKHGSLFDDLLNGTRSQQISAFMLTYTFFGVNITDGVYWGSIALKDLSPSQCDLLERTALGYLERDLNMTPTEYGAVFGCLSRFPLGPKTLLEHARRAKGTRRAYALSAATGGVRELKLGEAVLAPYLPDALAWLDGDDRDVHKAVFGMIHEYPSDSSWFKPQKTGIDAPIVEACRRFLDKHPGRHDFSCLTILANATPEIGSRDVDRIAAALDRAMTMMTSNFERTGIRPQGSIDELHEKLYGRLKKHAARPAAQKALELRQRLLDEGIVTRPRAK